MIPTKYLTRYWFSFEPFPEPTPLNLGCGVTAFDYEDALMLLDTRVFRESGIPPIKSRIENVDVRDLEQRHVAPNIGVVSERGIWFPLTYHAPLRKA
jgi:hypothetical protein